jgi:hypothetical protein
MVRGKKLSDPVWTEETFALVREGIRLATKAYTATLPQEWDEKVAQRAADLGKPHSDLDPGNLNIVIFHIKIAEDAGAVKAPDIRGLDHDQVDYETLIRANIDIALKTNPRARIFLITDCSFLSELRFNGRLNVSRIAVNAREPMFERVVTMAAYIRSGLFQQPTVFLDSDAFLLRPVHNLFANRFDVGLTHRNIVGQMPINEGVIFANTVHKAKVKALFDAYLASYLSIEKNSEIARIYTNLRRWRGGQLSLNSVGQGWQVYASRLLRVADLRVAYLPCSQYNLSEISEQEVTAALCKRTAVLHLKGLRKSWLHALLSMLGVSRPTT